MPAGLMTNRACLKASSHEAGLGLLAKEVPAIGTRGVPVVAALAESSTGGGWISPARPTSLPALLPAQQAGT